MTGELTTYISLELAKFNITDAAIAQMKERYMPLTIKGIEDKQGYTEVRAARILVKGKRVEVEKTRKALKEDSLKFGRAVDAEAKRITVELETIETHLETQEAAVDAEKERIRQEQERIRQERLHARISQITGLGMTFNAAGYEYGEFVIFNEQINTMSDEEFMAFCGKVSVEVEKEKARLAEEERLKKEEAERIAKAEEEERLKREAEAAAERERIEAEKKRLAEIEWQQRRKEEALKAEQERLEAEKYAIEEAKEREVAEKRRQAELEQLKKDAAEKALREAEERARREAEEKAEAERQAKLEVERKEALRPDKEKMVAFAGYIECLKYPVVENAAASAALSEAKKMILKVSAYLRKEANNL